MVGVLLGYLTYDCLHYAMHHSRLRHPLLASLQVRGQPLLAALSSPLFSAVFPFFGGLEGRSILVPRETSGLLVDRVFFGVFSGSGDHALRMFSLWVCRSVGVRGLENRSGPVCSGARGGRQTDKRAGVQAFMASGAAAAHMAGRSGEPWGASAVVQWSQKSVLQVRNPSSESGEKSLGWVLGAEDQQVVPSMTVL
jgi:hypothetical protein